MSPERIIEGPLGPAVEHPPVRLTPAAAERVQAAMTEALIEITPGATVACECGGCRGKRAVMMARTAEALVAELRLAGWTVAPPAEKQLRGGL